MTGREWAQRKRLVARKQRVRSLAPGSLWLRVQTFTDVPRAVSLSLGCHGTRLGQRLDLGSVLWRSWSMTRACRCLAPRFARISVCCASPVCRVRAAMPVGDCCARLALLRAAWLRMSLPLASISPPSDLDILHHCPRSSHRQGCHGAAINVANEALESLVGRKASGLSNDAAISGTCPTKPLQRPDHATIQLSTTPPSRM